MKNTGRDRIIPNLQRTQRAAAAGRLLMGHLESWDDFSQPEVTDFETFGRRYLRASRAKFRTWVSKEIKKFCNLNFKEMTEVKLESLYLEVKRRRGLEIPLSEFETKFATLKEKKLIGAPLHCTVVISLWGLQLMFLEDMFSRDIIEAVRQLRSANKNLEPYQGKDFKYFYDQRDQTVADVQMRGFAERACLLVCFNLVESSLNGLAWNLS